MSSIVCFYIWESIKYCFVYIILSFLVYLIELYSLVDNAIYGKKTCSLTWNLRGNRGMFKYDIVSTLRIQFLRKFRSIALRQESNTKSALNECVCFREWNDNNTWKTTWKQLLMNQGSSWSWSYGSWIYNYLCSQCLLPLTLWAQIPLRWGVLNTTLCDRVCLWLAAVFSGFPHQQTNKVDRYNITEILLKVTLNTITLTPNELS
jgi:hypothetical protein